MYISVTKWYFQVGFGRRFQYTSENEKCRSAGGMQNGVESEIKEEKKYKRTKEGESTLDNWR